MNKIVFFLVIFALQVFVVCVLAMNFHQGHTHVSLLSCHFCSSSVCGVCFGDWTSIKGIRIIISLWWRLMMMVTTRSKIYNKQSKYGLKFVTVVRDKFSIISGLNYQFVVANDDGNNMIKHYEAVVWGKLSLK
ncbi:hypothetical protein IGI04_010283 [Brassica rapa subsp. trilocularis]|uniref:Cystatin domain-containing protein n=1 Tax=Brassica rapa subsp. trilocularis TaxID=1813537 RepID=A0ABQ7MZR0_BRACM|nr:hypothetical protein IGI04_010283 [Brassica rapa subsp. trilocularis]